MDCCGCQSSVVRCLLAITLFLVAGSVQGQGIRKLFLVILLTFQLNIKIIIELVLGRFG